MANITTIEILMKTAAGSGTGTDGDVYVGVGGREFYLDTRADDFESGSSRTYTLGAGSTTLFPELNDPRGPPLTDGDIATNAAWVRFAGRSRTDQWKLGNVAITLNGGSFPLFQMSPRFVGIWLGTHAGNVVTIPRHIDPT